MQVTIDLQRQVLAMPEHGIELSFESKDSLFYLHVICVVAQKMKDRATEGEARPRIPAKDIEREAICHTAVKSRPFSSVSDMHTGVYQAWRSRLLPNDKNCHYTLIDTTGKGISAQAMTVLHEFFVDEDNKKPLTQTYSLNVSPSDITIILSEAFRSAKYGNVELALKGLASLSSPEDIANEFVELLKYVTNPGSYTDCLGTSSVAIANMVQNAQLWKAADKGGFAGSLEEYAASYLKHLGIRVPASTVINGWFMDLVGDPWWIEAMTANPIAPDRPGEPMQSPHAIAEFARRQGDTITMMCVFHKAYLAMTVASRRDALIAFMNHQEPPIREQILKKWVAVLEGDAWLKIAEDPVKAFKVLQTLSRIASFWQQE